MTHDSGDKILQIDIVSDAVCPWCYIGKRNLEAALAELPELKVSIHWRPYQLDPTIPPQGLDRMTYMTRKFGDRVASIHERIAAAGQQAGLAFDYDAIKVSPNTLDAHRLIRWAWAANRQDAVVENLFRAFFVEGRDIGSKDVLIDIARQSGMDAAIVGNLLEGDADKEAVEADIGQARSLGVSGVPFFILDQKIGLSGAQPPEVMRAAIRRARETEDLPA
jgi:predicted DsbA family dithiol-disulfide isomerase